MARARRAVLPLVVVAGGVTVAAIMIENRPQAAQVEVEPPATFVQVQTARPATHTPVISAMGAVEAEKQVVLQPEVAGRVIEQNSELVAGGRVAAGDPLLRVDARDYSIAVESGKADLAQARLMVREERTLKQVAEHEWRDRPKGFSEETLDFALRQPHLDAAKARVSSARSRIAKARRDLSRTILRAPFDAVVLSEAVDIGQMVGPQTPVATLAGIARYWVRVSVPTGQLAHLSIPGVNADVERGSKAMVVSEPSKPSARVGHVIKLLGSVDQRGRMAQVVVAVDDPLGVTQPVAERELPLLLGTNVRVEIEGEPIPDVVALPRPALSEQGTVWVVDGDGRLRKRSVDVAWREPGRVLVRDGLAEGERVVVSTLTTATEGMSVTIDDPDAGG